MKFSLAIFTGVFAAVALGGSIAPRAKTSFAKPRDVDWDINHFTVAAGLNQEAYCVNSKDGNMIGGDAELAWQTGDGEHVQRTLIYHSKTLGVTVAFEGTNSSDLRSIINDVEAVQVDIDYRWKDTVTKGAKVMYGFQDAYLKVADKVAKKVPEVKKKYNERRLTLVGHSLGAAMTLIAAGHLEHVIEGGVSEIIAFGLPRTGNTVFADWFDRKFGNRFHYIINGKDWVPHLPTREMGYQHPSNEIWINPSNSTNWKLYPGQENAYGCNSVAPGWNSPNDHRGVYFHTQLGARQGHCPATIGQD